jgi:hypothetical protein
MNKKRKERNYFSVQFGSLVLEGNFNFIPLRKEKSWIGQYRIRKNGG